MWEINLASEQAVFSLTSPSSFAAVSFSYSTEISRACCCSSSCLHLVYYCAAAVSLHFASHWPTSVWLLQYFFLSLIIHLWLHEPPSLPLLFLLSDSDFFAPPALSLLLVFGLSRPANRILLNECVFVCEWQLAHTALVVCHCYRSFVTDHTLKTSVSHPCLCADDLRFVALRHKSREKSSEYNEVPSQPAKCCINCQKAAQ